MKGRAGEGACPECGEGRTFVFDTRPAPRGIRRRRRCDGCGHRWTTIELPAADLDAMVAEYRNALLALRQTVAEAVATALRSAPRNEA